MIFSHAVTRSGVRMLSAGLFLLAAPLRAEADPYYNLVYDFEVASFCGLTDESLFAVYSVKRQNLEEVDSRTTEQLTRVRIKAMAAADLEFNNRGLGGHRQWCASDGREGVIRIDPDRQ